MDRKRTKLKTVDDVDYFKGREWGGKSGLSLLKIQKSPSHRLPRIAWEASKKFQKMHKSKFLCSSLMQDMEKWFGRWDATHLLNHFFSNITTKEEVSCSFTREQGL